MNIGIGKMQDISIHDVNSIEFDDITKMSSNYIGDKYFTTLVIKTKDDQWIEINLFAKDKNILNKLTK